MTIQILPLKLTKKKMFYKEYFCHIKHYLAYFYVIDVLVPQDCSHKKREKAIIIAPFYYYLIRIGSFTTKLLFLHNKCLNKTLYSV